MEQELTSIGKCIFCNKMFNQDEIGKHLAKHLSQKEKEDIDKTTSTFYHIIVGGNELFLHVLVRGDSKMKTIDQFLRAIWLECCGHLSNFGYKKFNISMSETVAKVFAGKIKIFHDYDYGSTTQVDLKSAKFYALHLKENLLLLSRNEPLKLMCSECKILPAAYLCTTCEWNREAMFCEKCATMHEATCEDFADYAKMPIVNSPRMGVCGYEGGTIDTERDGVYKK